jgi:hypothetical protein
MEPEFHLSFLNFTMTYKVIPFVAQITHKDTSRQVAQQLENLVITQAESGWEFVRLESVETYIQADPGCFGLGAKPGYTSIYKMAVFKQ